MKQRSRMGRIETMMGKDESLRLFRNFPTNEFNNAHEMLFSNDNVKFKNGKMNAIYINDNYIDELERFTNVIDLCEYVTKKDYDWSVFCFSYRDRATNQFTIFDLKDIVVGVEKRGRYKRLRRHYEDVQNMSDKIATRERILILNNMIKHFYNGPTTSLYLSSNESGHDLGAFNSDGAYNYYMGVERSHIKITDRKSADKNPKAEKGFFRVLQRGRMNTYEFAEMGLVRLVSSDEHRTETHLYENRDYGDISIDRLPWAVQNERNLMDFYRSCKNTYHRVLSHETNRTLHTIMNEWTDIYPHLKHTDLS